MFSTYGMVGLAFGCAFWAIMAWLFKSVFPLWDKQWMKTTGWVICTLIAVYYGVLIFLAIAPIPSPH